MRRKRQEFQRVPSTRSLPGGRIRSPGSAYSSENFHLGRVCKSDRVSV
ncbi:hypothetical protein E2C01_098701 [Portunus trituberculatus]|uniref:Uncharacterized protein n=1 Tax=Portunus trituberculatus TaxID=210409 RepID=A0A5B7K3K7_PORTR|nr:hypothetical protein [Portunus trituberculatus]